MTTETVPADIAAAIDAFSDACQSESTDGSKAFSRRKREARAALEAAILRNADEMRAALERIEQGV